MTTRSLETTEQDSPKAIVQRGAEQADALMGVVKQAVGTSVKIKGRTFLRFEAWQTIARFNHCSATIEWTRPILELGELAGYEARAQVINIDTGIVQGAAESMCGLTEFVTRGQDSEMAKRNAARSMAQTRAAAKALRMVFSYVAVLAGYEATPAEEMPRDTEEELPTESQRPSAAPNTRQAPKSAPVASQEPPDKAEVQLWQEFWAAVEKRGYKKFSDEVARTLGAETMQDWWDSFPRTLPLAERHRRTLEALPEKSK